MSALPPPGWRSLVDADVLPTATELAEELRSARSHLRQAALDEAWTRAEVLATRCDTLESLLRQRLAEA